MTEAAFAKALRSFAPRKPFRPFFLEFLTGERILIIHPEAVAVYAGVAVFTTTDKRYRMFDTSSVVQVLDPVAG